MPDQCFRSFELLGPDMVVIGIGDEGELVMLPYRVQAAFNVARDLGITGELAEIIRNQKFVLFDDKNRLDLPRILADRVGIEKDCICVVFTRMKKTKLDSFNAITLVAVQEKKAYYARTTRRA
jgi:hypothetical protein